MKIFSPYYVKGEKERAIEIKGGEGRGVGGGGHEEKTAGCDT